MSAHAKGERVRLGSIMNPVVDTAAFSPLALVQVGGGLVPRIRCRAKRLHRRQSEIGGRLHGQRRTGLGGRSVISRSGLGGQPRALLLALRRLRLQRLQDVSESGLILRAVFTKASLILVVEGSQPLAEFAISACCRNLLSLMQFITTISNAMTVSRALFCSCCFWLLRPQADFAAAASAACAPFLLV